MKSLVGRSKEFFSTEEGFTYSYSYVYIYSYSYGYSYSYSYGYSYSYRYSYSYSYGLLACVYVLHCMYAVPASKNDYTKIYHTVFYSYNPFVI